MRLILFAIYGKNNALYSKHIPSKHCIFLYSVYLVFFTRILCAFVLIPILHLQRMKFYSMCKYFPSLICRVWSSEAIFRLISLESQNIALFIYCMCLNRHWLTLCLEFRMVCLCSCRGQANLGEWMDVVSVCLINKDKETCLRKCVWNNHFFWITHFRFDIRIASWRYARLVCNSVIYRSILQTLFV